MNFKLATIDIGSNTILMLIAEKIKDNDFKVLNDYHNIARLGEDFTDTIKYIKPEAKIRAISILKEYREIIENNKIQKVFAVATSAIREAENSDIILDDLKEALGYDIKIITGDEEAYYSYLGAVNKDDLETMVIDIGGGSTEIILGYGMHIKKRYSIDIGAVKLTKMFIKEHRPTEYHLNEMENYIKKKLSEHIQFLDYEKINKVYAVAGTPTTIAAVDLGLNDYDRDLIEGHKLTYHRIKTILDQFSSLSINDIIYKLKIHPKRADVITAGTKLLLEILEYFKVFECIASTKGLRYGMMKSIFYS